MPASRPAVPLDEARARVLDAMRTLPEESVALGDALGRTLARDILAPWPLPVADHSAMDGYAGRAADLRAGARLRLVGRAQAGAPHAGEVPPGAGVRILTGAEVPAGADTVVRQEDVDREGDRITIRVAPQPGANVRRQGEDAAEGATVLRAGAAIGAAQVAALAATGHDPLWVRRRPRVVLVTTGDELVPARAAGPGSVVDSAGPMLAAASRELGAEVTLLGPVPDEPARVQGALAHALATHPDLLLTVGGASVGDRDHVRGALAELGWRCEVPALALKPGKPGAFGLEGVTPIFALPGNPTAAFTVFHLLVAPALGALLGGEGGLPSFEGRLLDPLPGAGQRLLARRCVARLAGGEVVVAVPPGMAGSHRVASVATSNALALIPPGVAGLAAGEAVELVATDRAWWCAHAGAPS